MSKLAKAIVPVLFLAAAYYAVFGGEYSLFELGSARAAVADERVELVELEHQLDSLRAWADSLRTDPATLERIARERFGMIREGETLYRFVPPEGAGADGSVDESADGSAARDDEAGPR
jgi:cell division protein FtsB